MKEKINQLLLWLGLPPIRKKPKLPLGTFEATLKEPMPENFIDKIFPEYTSRRELAKPLTKEDFKKAAELITNAKISPTMYFLPKVEFRRVKTMKEVILTGIVSAIVAGVAVFFLFCGKSRSPYLKDAPPACVYILEEGYFTDGKSQVVAGMLGETCKGMTVFQYCDNRIKKQYPKLKTDSRDYEKEYSFCAAKLGK